MQGRGVCIQASVEFYFEDIKRDWPFRCILRSMIRPTSVKMHAPCSHQSAMCSRRLLSGSYSPDRSVVGFDQMTSHKADAMPRSAESLSKSSKPRQLWKVLSFGALLTV